MKKERVKASRGNKWKVENKLVSKERNIYITKNEKLKLEVI